MLFDAHIHKSMSVSNSIYYCPFHAFGIKSARESIFLFRCALIYRFCLFIFFSLLLSLLPLHGVSLSSHFSLRESAKSALKPFASFWSVFERCCVCCSAFATFPLVHSLSLDRRRANACIYMRARALDPNNWTVSSDARSTHSSFNVVCVNWFGCARAHVSLT